MSEMQVASSSAPELPEYDATTPEQVNSALSAPFSLSLRTRSPASELLGDSATLVVFAPETGRFSVHSAGPPSTTASDANTPTQCTSPVKATSPLDAAVARDDTETITEDKLDASQLVDQLLDAHLGAADTVDSSAGSSLEATQQFSSLSLNMTNGGKCFERGDDNFAALVQARETPLDATVDSAVSSNSPRPRTHRALSATAPARSISFIEDVRVMSDEELAATVSSADAAVDSPLASTIASSPAELLSSSSDAESADALAIDLPFDASPFDTAIFTPSSSSTAMVAAGVPPETVAVDDAVVALSPLSAASVDTPVVSTATPKSPAADAIAEQLLGAQAELAALRSERARDQAQLAHFRRVAQVESETRLLKEATQMYAATSPASTAFASQDRAAASASYAATILAPTAPLQSFPQAHLSRATPYTPFAPGLSTAHAIGLHPVAPAAYPAPASCFPFPLMRTMEPLIPVGHEAPGVIVFAKEMPSRSLTALAPAPSVPGPVFARGSRSFVPPPAWGPTAPTYRPRCAGDTEDLTSRWIEADADADSSDLWTAAHSPPTSGEITFDAPPHSDPLCTPHHAYLLPASNLNHPTLHPQPSPSPLATHLERWS